MGRGNQGSSQEGPYGPQKADYRPVVVNASCQLDKIQELSMPEGIILITSIELGHLPTRGATIPGWCLCKWKD